MALIVHALGAYASYPSDRIPWRSADYEMNKLVKSLKGETVKGYAQLRDVDRNLVRITDADPGPALQYFSAWAAKRLKSLGIARFVLVPVPSSSCASYRDVGAPYRMACAIQERMGRGVKVERWLRFVEKMTPSHDGGTRNVGVLADTMRVSAATVKGSQIVLVDDVKTTGAHCKAAAQRLRSHGMIVEKVIVAATTVWQQHPTPFDLSPEDIESGFGVDF